MPWAAAGAVVGGLLSSSSSKKAAKAQAASAKAASDAQLTAARESNALQEKIYDQNRLDSSPWANTGEGALNQLAWKMGITPTNRISGEKTREDYYNELVGQFTSTVTDPVAATGKKKKRKWWKRALSPDPRQHLDPFGMMGGKGGKGPTSRQVIDYAGLNAAADKAFSDQPVRTPYQGDEGDFGSLSKNFGVDDFHADPGYQFRMDEGNKGIERSAAARGGQLSGATMKALARFGQDTASNEYQNAYNRFNNDQSTQFNRLSGIAGTGQQQVNALGQAGQNYANSVGNNTMSAANNVANNTIGAGNARAGSYMATANGINNAIGTGINTWQQNRYLNNMNNMTSYGTTPGSQQSNMLAAQW